MNIIDFETTSKKIDTIPKTLLSSDLVLPEKNWSPFFLKWMSEFMEFHKLPKTLLDNPKGHIKISDAMSQILNIMVHSMGDKKREELLKDLSEYKTSLELSNLQ